MNSPHQTTGVLTAAAILVAALATCGAPAAENLVVNGTFEDGETGWDPLPNDGTVLWATDDAAHNNVIRFILTKGVAEGPGLLWYSDHIAVEQGKTYRFTFDAKSSGPVLRPFVKGYAALPDAHGDVDLRPVYQKQNKYVAGEQWQTFSFDFVPQTAYMHADVPIRWVRVMLYAYLKEGECTWDNISITELASLVPNGDFEAGTDHPDGWEPLPDDESVRWEREPRSGKCILVVPPDGERTMYSSAEMRVTMGYRYRFAVDVKAHGAAPEALVEGLAPSKTPDAFDVLTTYAPEPFAGGRAWTTWSFDFTVERPEHPGPANTVRWVRVQLAASGGPGSVYYDNVRIEPLGLVTHQQGKQQW